MAFTLSEIQADLEGVPGTSFNGAAPEAREGWIQFVLGLEAEPKAKHDLRWYTALARLMSEAVSSVHPSDFSDEIIRDVLKSAFVAGDTPFTAEENPASWKAVKVSPAMTVYALRAQAKCCSVTKPGETGTDGTALGSTDGLAEAMRDFVKCQSDQAKSSKKGLSFDRTERAKEIGLEFFPRDALPNEELLIKWEAAGRVAADKGRFFVGSPDGDDLQLSHRPAWSRTPVIEAMPSEGSWEDRLKASFEVRKARAAEEKVSVHGFATFIGHLYSWGMN